MIETNYVLTYMKTYFISTVSKGQFSVMYYISNTVILYFIVHCTYVHLYYVYFLHVIHTLISYATCVWPDMYRFQ